MCVCVCVVGVCVCGGYVLRMFPCVHIMITTIIIRFFQTDDKVYNARNAHNGEAAKTQQ